MDVASIMTAVSVAGTGIGGYVGGRLSARSSASQIAADTVDMLQAQIELLKSDKQHSELEILDLLQRVAVLEGLVTQRAAVEELIAKTSMVKETVDKIAVRVGA